MKNLGILLTAFPEVLYFWDWNGGGGGGVELLTY
jgi:hypothetical protein